MEMCENSCLHGRSWYKIINYMCSYYIVSYHDLDIA